MPIRSCFQLIQRDLAIIIRGSNLYFRQPPEALSCLALYHELTQKLKEYTYQRQFWKCNSKLENFHFICNTNKRFDQIFLAPIFRNFCIKIIDICWSMGGTPSIFHWNPSLDVFCPFCPVLEPKILLWTLCWEIFLPEAVKSSSGRCPINDYFFSVAQTPVINISTHVKSRCCSPIDYLLWLEMITIQYQEIKYQ